MQIQRGLSTGVADGRGVTVAIADVDANPSEFDYSVAEALSLKMDSRRDFSK
ncbi:hypothetical protein KHP11_28285 [Rhodococcus erythropolis]|uniref:hypothetical protein n=1 Tax=Rhodococcus erythropolis TaxID=1833 RepID=UPI0012928819|nr:hypothetical protein [Rhodococcus erythropolis]MBT1258359.1 hypothetical protein [Rhodococcus erythropolis]